MRSFVARAAVLFLALTVLSAQAPVRVDPVYEAAKAAFERLDEPERKAIQDALVWTSDYNGVVGGVFGRRTFEAILAVQKRLRAPADGILDAKAKGELIAAASRERQAAGFEIKADDRASVRIGVPLRLLREIGAVPGAVPGTRWQSADEKITLDTRSYRPDEQQLPELYERIVGSNVRGRKITYKILRPDFFVVQGETATGKFFIRSDAGAGGVRGFSVGYDKALAPRFDRMVIAIANSFEPFPSAARPSSPAQPQAVSARPAAQGTVLVIAPGKGVTSAAAFAACGDPRVGGRPARLASSDRASGVALIDIAPDAGRAAVLARPSGTQGGLVVLARGGGEKPLLVTPGERAGEGRITAALQPGSSGAVAFDRTGALVGLVTDTSAKPRLIAGVAPPAAYPLASGAIVESLSPDIRLPSSPAGESQSAGEIAARLAPSLLALECGR
jgi:hypothetical protein